MSLSGPTLKAAWPSQTATVKNAAEQAAVGGPMSGDGWQLAAGMAATLSAELTGAVAHDLVAETVKAILDEGRRDGQQLAADSTTHEARQRLIRARSAQ